MPASLYFSTMLPQNAVQLVQAALTKLFKNPTQLTCDIVDFHAGSQKHYTLAPSERLLTHYTMIIHKSTSALLALKYIHIMRPF